MRLHRSTFIDRTFRLLSMPESVCVVAVVSRSCFENRRKISCKRTQHAMHIGEQSERGRHRFRLNFMFSFWASHSRFTIRIANFFLSLLLCLCLLFFSSFFLLRLLWLICRQMDIVSIVYLILYIFMRNECEMAMARIRQGGARERNDTKIEKLTYISRSVHRTWISPLIQQRVNVGRSVLCLCRFDSIQRMGVRFGHFLFSYIFIQKQKSKYLLFSIWCWTEGTNRSFAFISLSFCERNCASPTWFVRTPKEN